jgi:pyruvate-formate lyase-activating enzyme
MDKIQYYRGKHKVKVVTESVGFLTVEALEDFEDVVDGAKVKVKKGETRIVPTVEVCRQKGLAPMVKEHAYELHMEKKLKRMVDEEEKKKGKAAKP